MSISANGKRVVALTQDMALRWEQTRNYWQDTRSQEFQHKFIDDLVQNVDNAVGVMEELDKLVAKARRDCE